MAIPHYAYMVINMPGPRGVISIRGDVKGAYDYDKEGCEMADRLTATVELWELKEALAESRPSPGPSHSQLQGFQNVPPRLLT
jgi:hypothetical protein